MRRRGFTMAEIAITVGVLAALGIPVLALITAGTRETIASEDNVEAELTCSKLVEEKLAKTFEELDREAPLDEQLEADVDPERGGARPSTGGSSLPARGYLVHRTIKRVTPDLLSLEVAATWKAEGRVRRYAVLRLVARETVSAGGGPTE